MKQDVQESTNKPLSTATLAHADDLPAESRDQATIDRRGSDPALREADRPPIDGGPTLVPPRAGMSAQQNRADGQGNQQAVAEEGQASPLFSQQESKDLFAKWDALQVGFVDEPRRAVEQADNLVAAAMKRLAEVFAQERSRLESQWDRGDNVSTEDLRIAMRRYRSFFRRLLAV